MLDASKLKCATLALALIIGGCTSKYTFFSAKPELKPIGENEFEYEASTFPLGWRWHTADHEIYENSRMRWLELLLDQEEMCPGGYVITDRQVLPDERFDDEHRIHYRGICR